ncbi:EP300-interacting inhibitor of differentiation 3-like [Branchiostoma floridae x Branchiostoma japonicum]
MPGTGRSRSGGQADREPRDNTAENGGPAAGDGAGESDGLGDQEPGTLASTPGRSEADMPDRRQLRHKYRTLINETQKNRLDLIRPESKGLNDMLNKANGYFKSVKMTREAALDSQFLVLASTLGSQKANQLHTDFVTFEPHVFADKLVSFMTGRRTIPEDADEDDEDEEENRRRAVRIPAAGWEKLGEDARRCFNRAPAFHFLYGSFNREAKARESRKLNRKDASKSVGPKTVPKQVKNCDENSKEQTTAEVEFIHKALRTLTVDEDGNVDPIDYFEFVFDPESFGRTVENIFHLSFLVRDGHARIYLNDEHLPVLEPAEPYTEAESDDRVERNQVVVSLTLKDWKRIKKEFEITSRYFPRRVDFESGEGPSGGQNGHTSSDDEDGPPPRQRRT